MQKTQAHAKSGSFGRAVAYRRPPALVPLSEEAENGLFTGKEEVAGRTIPRNQNLLETPGLFERLFVSFTTAGGRNHYQTCSISLTAPPTVARKSSRCDGFGMKRTL